MSNRQTRLDYLHYPQTRLEDYHAGLLTLKSEDGKPLAATWMGGDVIGVTAEVLEMGDRQVIRRDGDIICIAQFTLRILGVYGQPNALVYICQRVREGVNAEAKG